MQEVGVGADASWRQRVIALGPGGPSGESHEVTPNSGKVTIQRTVAGGVVEYWDGSAFVAGPAIELTTTINGKSSDYAFTTTQAMRGNVIRFEGWIDDDRATCDSREIFVSAGSSAKLKFKQ